MVKFEKWGSELCSEKVKRIEEIMKKPEFIDPSLQQQIEKRAMSLSFMKERQYKKLLKGLEQHFGNLKSGRATSGGKGGSTKGKGGAGGRKVLSLVGIKAQRRASRIREACVGLPIRVHNGREWKTFLVKAAMVGYPVGAFVPTRSQKSYRNRGKKKLLLVLGKVYKGKKKNKSKWEIRRIRFTDVLVFHWLKKLICFRCRMS